jgi:transcriptional regulator with XRE-family HTH domain
MFDEWFNQRYLEWRGERYGQDVSVKAFARYIGLTQQSVDSYLKGKSVPRQKNIINKLVDKFGADVYRELGLIINNQQELVIEINRLPPELYPELVKRIKELRAGYIPRKPAHKDSSEVPGE